MSHSKAIKILLPFFPLLTVCLKEIECTLHLDVNILKVMFMSIYNKVITHIKNLEFLTQR